jgi:serine/threonine-protein kinase
VIEVGQTLCGKYKVESLLGQGGMATVWQGTHLATGRRIAIKVLDERFAGNERVAARFGREARAASAIQHESIVDVLDLDRGPGGEPFLVMEFLEGETLTQRIERKLRLTEAEILAIADPLLDALHAAHEAGVIHRDLKPDNIMLVPLRRKGERLKVLDFGISSKADEVSSLTTTGSLLGTPHYMSPEQAKGRTDIDRRADIWAIGVLLYECAAGVVPFDAENYNALIQEVLHTEPVPPRQRGAQISEAFERVILSAIAKDRANRPATAEVLREQLLAVGVAVPSITSSSSGSYALDPADGTRTEREKKSTVDAPSAATSLAAASLATAPTAQAPVPAALRRPPNESPLASLASTPPPSAPLELDVDAVRVPPRKTPAAGSARSSVAGGAPLRAPSRAAPMDDAASGPEPFLSRRPVRIAIAAFVALLALILIVRFVVRPLLPRAEVIDSTRTTISP